MSEAMNVVNFYVGLTALAIFGVYHWKEIWKAAKGGNGMPQPMELTKLFSVFIYIVYCNKILFIDDKFDWDFGMFIALMMGVANIGDVKSLLTRKKVNEGEGKNEDV